MKVLIFNLNGTFVDSKPPGAQAFNDLVPQLEDPAGALINWCRGRKLADLIEEPEQQYGISLAPDFIPVYRRELHRLFEENLQPNESARQLLAQLNQPICIVSNVPRTKLSL